MTIFNPGEEHDTYQPPNANMIMLWNFCFREIFNLATNIAGNTKMAINNAGNTKMAISVNIAITMKYKKTDEGKQSLVTL